MNHPEAAKVFNEKENHVDWHNKAVWLVRTKRDIAASKIKEWESLRTLASKIKESTLSNLDEYLIQFEKEALKNNIHVHWALDAKAHNEIVLEILKRHGAKRIVKSKSMLTEECGLNEYLEKNGLEVTDSDLGERIIQLAKETPSHIVMPAIHKTREEIDDLFHKHLNTKLSGGDEVYLTREARKHLRQKFVEADAAITGVNFAVVETGGFVVCTNEGNADMGVHSTKLHIACMGLEKIIPELKHLGIFLRLLARSATGQSITTYTSYYKSPMPGNEIHVVIVDNGRSEQLGRKDFRSSLHCIRCGACMNTCPVYRRSGGHSYGSTIPGPIGSILSPGIDLEKYRSLPFASSLCGSCTEVCPVKIDIHTQLYKWRQIITGNTRIKPSKKIIAVLSGFILSHPMLFRAGGKIARVFLRITPQAAMNTIIGSWTNKREFPEPPEYTFTEWYKRKKNNES